jgi:hypothetical protein
LGKASIADVHAGALICQRDSRLSMIGQTTTHRYFVG